MAVRKKRVEWSVTSHSGPTGFMSGILFSLGISHLKAGLSEREHTLCRSATNHYCEQALSCIVMMAGGIEALVNALVWMEISPGVDHPELRDALTKDTVECKYRRAQQQGTPIPPDCINLLHI